MDPLRGPLLVLVDVFQDLSDLTEIWRLHGQETLCGRNVGPNGHQGLAELVCNRRGQLSEGCNPIHAGELVAMLPG